jgi:cobalt-zinc-cadmium efflux system protein
MGHAHTHTHGSGARVRHALRWSLALNGAFLVIEAAVGFWSGSLALLSDAAHMVSDVSALTLALVVAELARRPASRGRTFGLVRAEVLGAFVNALLLGGACVLLGSQAIARLYSGASEFHAEPVLIVGILGLGINLGSAWLLARSDRGNLNIRGALAHMLADALGSVGAILAAVLGGSFNLHAADPILSLLICVMILLGTWTVLRDSTRVLLDFVPENLPQERVEAALRGLPGVHEIHELHLWSTGSQTMLTAHLVPAPGVDPTELLARAELALRGQLQIHHSTIQIDAPTAACEQHTCPLLHEVETADDHHGHDHHGHDHHGHAHHH